MNDFAMRPMDVTRIIDQTIKIYRSNFKAIILFTLLIGGTANLIAALLQMGPGITIWESPLASILQGDLEELGPAFEAFLYSYSAAQSDFWLPMMIGSAASLIIAIFVTPLVTGGITYITLAVSHGSHRAGVHHDDVCRQALFRLHKTQLIKTRSHSL